MSKKKISAQEKTRGIVYTPEFIVNDILDLAGYYDGNIINKHVIDNSCGDGAFLKIVIKRLIESCIKNNFSKKEIKRQLSQYVHGIEINQDECSKCIENVNKIAASYGLNKVKWDIICADTLSTNKYDHKMDFVVGNPPYIRVHNLGDNFNKAKKFAFSQNGMTDLYIVFYEIGLRMLNENGVLGYITPSSFFNSVAGAYMRKYFISNNLLDKIVDLKHFQAFNSTTYTTIVILKKNRTERRSQYFQFDEKNLKPYHVEDLLPDEYFILGNFYFSNKENLAMLKKVFLNLGHCNISVKNGYATLSDDVFINKFNFSSNYIIPVIKASRGALKQIIFPYDTKADLIGEDELKKDKELYKYLLQHKLELCNRSRENKRDNGWYAFGRSQALADTFKNKIAINTLLRDSKDLKIIDAPSGTGVYSGLYLVGKNINYQTIKNILIGDEFSNYVALLGKYKNGGYYTFSSKDVKMFLDYKLAYNGGLFE